MPKISQLEEATDVTQYDLIQIVDVEDEGMAISGTNKKVSAQLMANELGKLTNITATGSNTARSLANRFADTVNVKDFGAKGDGVTDDTAAIQAALNSAKTTSRCVFIPKGAYIITQIAIPNGLRIYGAGIGGYGSITTTYLYDTTKLIQKSGVNDDAIVFDCPLDGSGNYRLFNIHLSDFIVLKQGVADTLGNGISARQVGTDRNVNSNHCLVNGLPIFERLLVRGFPENGMYFKQGAVPLYCNDLNFIFNGGYGLRIDGLNYLRNVIIRNVSGDGNKGRACIRIGSSNPHSQIAIDGVYSEYRSDNPYGNSTGFNGAQPYAIEVVDFNSNSTVSIANVLQESIVVNEASAAAIFVNNSALLNTPKIEFSGIVIGDLDAASGIKKTIYDGRAWDSYNSFSIPANVSSGVYSLVSTGSTTSTQFSNGHTAFGNGFVKPVVSDQGIQANGQVPSLSLYESDAVLDSKGWYINASGGVLYFRTYDDASTNNDIYAQVVRSGYNVSYFEFLKKLRLSNLSVYADNAAAISGGLSVGDIYRTSTGDIKVRY